MEERHSRTGRDFASLAEQVAARRAELGLSLCALQERSGIHYSHLSKVESGDDKPGLNTLAGLSRGLEVPLTELLQAAEVSANLDLPSFAGYLGAVVPELPRAKRRELEVSFERLTGRSAATLPGDVEAGRG